MSHQIHILFSPKIYMSSTNWNSPPPHSRTCIRPCKVLSEKNAYKSVKTASLLSNVIDADHQNSSLFTNKGHFSPFWVSIGVLAKLNFMSNTLPIALTRLLEHILIINSV